MKGQKVVIAGLDQAGKTSIIQRVFFNADPEDIVDMDATRGINREHIKLNQEEDQFVFWELGGQQRYVEDYTGRPQVFSQTELLIFVIDIQDDNRYDVAIEYLQQLLMILRETSNYCHVTVIMHKLDPNMAASLRSKQFVMLKLLKSVQKQFNSFQFSQHSTSIFDDTLFYTYQNIFQRLGIDIGAYKAKIQTSITLKGQPQERTRTQEIISKELINRLESIYESANSGMIHAAPEFNELRGINKLHQVMEKFITQFHEYESIDTKREAVDTLIMGYLEFIADLTIESLQEQLIAEDEAQMLFIYIGQLNVIKVRFIRYVTETKPSKITNPLKFMEQLKQLTNDLLDSSFIVSNITLTQLQNLKQLINSNSNPNFSLFVQDTQDVYTFTSIQELKSAFSQDKFVPSKMIIQIELAEQMKNKYSEKLTEILNTSTLDPLEEEALSLYNERVDFLILEFYEMVLEKNLREYEIDRTLENRFYQITMQLLTIANLGNIISDDEKFRLRNVFETNR